MLLFIEKKVSGFSKKPWIIIDVGAGNCLFSLLTIFLFPNISVLAIDNHPCPIDSSKVQRFEYREIKIPRDAENLLADLKKLSQKAPLIFVGIHLCRDLSRIVIQWYKTFGTHVFLMPCCVGKFKLSFPRLFKETFGKEDLWAIDLWHEIHIISEKSEIFRDEKILSPRNILIWGKTKNAPLPH